MKTLLFIFTLLISNTSIYSQNFSISELIKLNNYQIDDFDTYVTQKGYVYFGNKSDFFSEGTSYVFYLKGVKQFYITKFNYKTEPKKMVSFQTSSSTTYLKIKSELKNLGFKFYNTEINEGTTFFNYKRGLIEVSLASLVQENNFGNKNTVYEISITKTL